MSREINQLESWQRCHQLGVKDEVQVWGCIQMGSQEPWNSLRRPNRESFSGTVYYWGQKSPSSICVAAYSLKFLTSNLTLSHWDPNSFIFLIFSLKMKNFTAASNLLKFSQQVSKGSWNLYLLWGTFLWFSHYILFP